MKDKLMNAYLEFKEMIRLHLDEIDLIEIVCGVQLIMLCLIGRIVNLIQRGRKKKEVK